MNHLTKDLYICDKCGLISSDIPPDLTVYDKSYCIKYSRYAQTDIGDAIQRLRYKFIKKHVKTGKLLDFGCGYGTFIDTCNLNGIKASGFDINPHSGFCDVSRLLTHYDIVTYWDTVEHLVNPIDIISGLNAKWIFLSTPSIDDFNDDWSNLPKWHHYYPGEHVHHFSLESISVMLNMAGYMVISYNYDESKFRTSGGNKNILTIGAKRIG